LYVPLFKKMHVISETLRIFLAVDPWAWYRTEKKNLSWKKLETPISLCFSAATLQFNLTMTLTFKIVTSKLNICKSDDCSLFSSTFREIFLFVSLKALKHGRKAICYWQFFTVTLTFNPRQAMIVTHTSKNQGRNTRSVGSKDRMKTDVRTDTTDRII